MPVPYQFSHRPGRFSIRSQSLINFPYPHPIRRLGRRNPEADVALITHLHSVIATPIIPEPRDSYDFVYPPSPPPQTGLDPELVCDFPTTAPTFASTLIVPPPRDMFGWSRPHPTDHSARFGILISVQQMEVWEIVIMCGGSVRIVIIVVNCDNAHAHCHRFPTGLDNNGFDLVSMILTL